MAGIPRILSYQIPRREEIISNRVHWQIASSEAVLLVHDMQRFFTRALPCDIVKSLTSSVATLIGWARQHNIPVAYTAQPGRMTEGQRGLLRDFWGNGMRTETYDREIESCCMAREGDWRLKKWRYSAFLNTDLLNLMRRNRKGQLIICGVYAHVGILATAIDSFSHDIETFIVSDAVADFTRDDHLHALNHAARTCASIVSVQEVLTINGC